MSRDLRGLAERLGCALDERSAAQVDVLMTAVECVDRHLDAIGERDARRLLGRDVLRALEGTALDGELGVVLRRLREVLVARGVADQAIAITAEIFEVTERMRNARSVGDYVAACCCEGELLVDAAVLMMPEANQRLRAFLSSIAGPANLLDKLIDARDDHRTGALAMRPGVRFHLRLVRELVVRLPAAVVAHGQPLALAAWALPYLRLLRQ